MIDHGELAQVQETGTLPRLTDRERRRAVAAVPAPDGGRYLAVESGTDEVLIPLTAAVTRVGRGIASDVTLDDASVSRRHALVVVRGERCVLLEVREGADQETTFEEVGGEEVRSLPAPQEARVRYSRT